MDGSVSSATGAVLGFIFNGFGSQSAIELSIILALLICSSLIALAEVSFFSLSPSDFEIIKQDSSYKAQKLLSLTNNTPSLIATIVMSHNLVNIGVVILSEMLFDSLFDFEGNGLLVFIVEVVVVTFIILLVGEVIPKIYASKNPRHLALKYGHIFLVVQKILYPFVYVLVQISKGFDTKIKQKAPDLSVDQLSQALELTTGEQPPDEEKKILQGIVEFGNIEVSQIMTPRLDLVAFEYNTPFNEIIELVIKNGFSRVPIYKESIDNIEGILFIKDLIAYLDKDASFSWQSLIRAPFFVPESKKIDDLMKEFQNKKIHLAIVVDEYGGTNGIVTLEDIIEEVVGEINDEFDEEELVYSKLDDLNYVFEAKILLNDLYKVLNINGQEFEEKRGESDTLAGFILELSGKIPLKNEKITFANYIFSIESVDKRRIKRVKMTIINKPDEEKTSRGHIIPSIILMLPFALLLLFSSCDNEFTPKPKGYYRIDLPAPAYQIFKPDCPFEFEYSTHAIIKPYSQNPEHLCWFNIYYPKYKATIHFSYNALTNKQDLEKQLNDSRTLAYKHTAMADGIEEFLIKRKENNMYGLIYLLSGNSASQTQFYLTDSVHHFVRGALYFNAAPNADSIAPVLKYMNYDIDYLINSFRWKN